MGSGALVPFLSIACLLSVSASQSDTFPESPSELQNDGPSVSNNHGSSANDSGEISITDTVKEHKVTFNWTETPQPNDPQYSTSYKEEFLACDMYTTYSSWNDTKKDYGELDTKPYTKVSVMVKNKISNKMTSMTVNINATEPEANVTDLRLTEKNEFIIRADIENDCKKYNGPNMKVKFVLKATDEKPFQKPIIRNKFVVRNRAQMNWKQLDLLPFTNYTVTAFSANDVGANKNPNLSRSITFMSTPATPGEVTNLTVVEASPHSLTVAWSPPADDPPRGILQDVNVNCNSSSGSFSKLMKWTTSYTIEDLTPNTSYNVTVRARNKDVEVLGNAASIIATTKEAVPEGDVSTSPETRSTTLLPSGSTSGTDNTAITDEGTSTTTHISTTNNTSTGNKEHTQNATGSGNTTPIIDTTTMKTDAHWRYSYSTNMNTIELSVNWTQAKAEFSYNIELRTNENVTIIKKYNTSETKFVNLTSGTRYFAMVSACFEERCLNLTLELWTRPDKPHVQENITSQLEATDTTISIPLPILDNPPGAHWVLLKNDNGATDNKTERTSDIKNKAVEIVQENNKRRKRRSVDQLHNDMGLQIVMTVEVEAGNKAAPKTAELGGNSGGGDSLLKSNTQYIVIIVTETRAGPYSKYCSSEPRVVRTARSRRHTVGDMTGLIVGLSAGWVLLMVIVAVVVVKCRAQSRRNKGADAADAVSLYISFHRDLGTSICRIEKTDDKAPKKDDMNGRRLTENSKTIMMKEKELDQRDAAEDVYANATHEISKEDLEMYLPRAIFAEETILEFESVPSIISDKKALESFIPENMSKNRYKNTVSYDDTRVRLPLYNNIPHTDYINANFIQGPSGRVAFIATQGPKDHDADTIGAFWRMIWHTKCSMILMVANLVEGGKAKVAQYWPEAELLFKEGVQVKLTFVRTMMDFVVRTFTLTVNKMERKVTQYQYTAWPDHGVPMIAYGLGEMLKVAIRQYGQESGGPITVHCSAGIGRTGTIILTLFMVRQIKIFNAFNPRKALLALRMGRGRLVENKEQYIFAHKLLYQILLFGAKTTFPCKSFLKAAKTLLSSRAPDGTSLLQKEFKKIKSLPKDLTFSIAKDPECVHFNRNQEILPADKRVVCVHGYGSGPASQYLNVIRVNSFEGKDIYLAGEHPQPNTLARMWRLVFERRVSVWLLLQELPLNDPSFPDVLRVSVQPHLTLAASQPRHLQNFVEYSVTLTANEKTGRVQHQCKLLMLKGWPHTAKLPSSPVPILAAIEKAESFLSSQTSLLFTCRDGVTGCGVMAALLVVVSMAKLTQEVDVYRSVVSVQYDRPQFIRDFEQYMFLYRAMETFLDTNKHYGNFA